MFSSFNISKRFSLHFAFAQWFIIVSFLLRIGLIIYHFDEVSLDLIDIFRTILTGLLFDFGVVAFFSIPSIIYLVLLPNKIVGSVFDKIITYSFFSLTIFILIFTFFAEITFWDEFKNRFNFIAVDYLIYTHEVVKNIQQSYPIPLLIVGVGLFTALMICLFHKKRCFLNVFKNHLSLKQRVLSVLAVFSIVLFYSFFITNSQAEWSKNRYNNEISKAGIYSFFAAFRNNQMKFEEFYTSLNNKNAFSIVDHKLSEKNSFSLPSDDFSIKRTISDSLNPSQKNVVFILMESMSASFMKEFGNELNITPFMDELAQKSIFFSNLYATGTRTVRGMEAVTLCIPPTPGQSIVKRPNNHNLMTIASVFKSKNYNCNFFYGGDGYFDNMNSYFGGNGFDIYDRGRGSILSDDIKTTRHNIEDHEVTFENAWGICDEDIYTKMLKVADEKYDKKMPFFNFVMTTSNHRPYTYPENKVSIPSGMCREGAVQYNDYALKMFFEKAKMKPWFKNTIFVVIADHCASSAGKDEIDVENYHIPAFIYNMDKIPNQKVMKQCSQIDLFPTLFSLMHWDYKSNFFGKNVFNANFEERAFVGTYLKLALMKQNKVMILSNQKKQHHYLWKQSGNSLKPLPMDKKFLNETISWYQTADYLFSNNLLKE